MADTSDKNPGAGGGGDVHPDRVQIPPQEEDALFRLQMAVSDFVLGYWKYGVYALGVVLLAAGVYGGVTSWRQSQRRADYEAIARVDHRMPKDDGLGGLGLSLGGAGGSPNAEELAEGARRFVAAGDEASGTAAVYAYLKAAEAWQRGGNATERLAALEKAWKVGAKDMPGWSAGSAYAAALRDAGRTDEAVAVYKQLAAEAPAPLAQDALLTLADTQLAAGKTDEAKATVQDFVTRFPDSPRLPELQAVQARIGSGG